jgi:hypothetical protein
MNENRSKQRGYVFALPRVVSSLLGGKPRRAKWSRLEAFGFGTLVFLIACVFCGRELLLLVRPWIGRILILLILPPVVWAGFLLLYYLDSLLIALLRKVRLYSAPTNERLQHFIIMTLITLIALHFLRDSVGWISGLGTIWFMLVGMNIFCIFFERLLDES